MTAIETKTFMSGNSVAVRLPKALAIGPDERMVIERDGENIYMRRVINTESERRTVSDLLAALAAIGRPDDGVQSRPDFEAPDRLGL